MHEAGRSRVVCARRRRQVAGGTTAAAAPRQDTASDIKLFELQVGRGRSQEQSSKVWIRRFVQHNMLCLTHSVFGSFAWDCSASPSKDSAEGSASGSLARATRRLCWRCLARSERARFSFSESAQLGDGVRQRSPIHMST